MHWAGLQIANWKKQFLCHDGVRGLQPQATFCFFPQLWDITEIFNSQFAICRWSEASSGWILSNNANGVPWAPDSRATRANLGKKNLLRSVVFAVIY